MQIGARANSVAVGDLNGDSALDIILGGYLSTIFFNDRAGRFTSAQPLFSGGRIAVADMDNDSDLDVIVYGPAGSAVYLNDGAGSFSPSSAHSFAQVGDEIQHIAVGDLDGDGDRDVVAGIRQYAVLQGQRSTAYLNSQQSASPLPNNPPTVRVARPGPTPEANFYSTPAIVASPVISISYTLADPEGDPVRDVRGEYSLNGGGSWHPAAASVGSVTTDLPAPKMGTAYVFGWDTFASGFFGQSDNVVFRIIAQPTMRSLPNQTPYTFQRPTISVSSPPFRARGTQVKVVNGTGMGVPHALVLRRPWASVLTPRRSGSTRRRVLSSRISATRRVRSRH